MVTTLDDNFITLEELENIWSLLSKDERIEAFHTIPRHEAEEFFLALSSKDQAEILLNLPHHEKRSWARLLAPDDMADILQSVDKEPQELILHHLDEVTKKEVTALLAYAEDEAGGLMSPRYARLRAEMKLDEAISYLKQQTRTQIESVYYIYVLDEQQHLLGVVSFRELFSGNPNAQVKEVMTTDIIKVHEDTDQESLSKLFSQYKLLVVPVVDPENRLKGIITVDDVVDVIKEEATEDIQKIGGMEALDMPYLKIGFFHMIKKRAGWLSALFLGEMLTATAMAHFEGDIAKAVILALFIPLIISSGGNSGSQATTLVIRAMALGEVTLRHWFYVIRRELFSGLVLGSILGFIGFIRIIIWEFLFHPYGTHFLWVALTVFISLIGVVTFGTFAGSTLPFVLKRLKFDPASASAPFVATLVDVTGLVIYFSIAAIILRGTLL